MALANVEEHQVDIRLEQLIVLCKQEQIVVHRLGSKLCHTE